ncbi:hypothetical protein F2P81_004037 [Scophthalmus maximus]|uniref:Uncharacterized protein n=1 Tax=Scophthalmus maximus TaxID=52904 RepID=A0A6A4TG12_SCOMX|nr:hypothetical protein F2P81_004037 [Scophthalmus maximus]
MNSEDNTTLSVKTFALRRNFWKDQEASEGEPGPLKERKNSKLQHTVEMETQTADIWQEMEALQKIHQQAIQTSQAHELQLRMELDNTRKQKSEAEDRAQGAARDRNLVGQQMEVLREQFDSHLAQCEQRMRQRGHLLQQRFTAETKLRETLDDMTLLRSQLVNVEKLLQEEKLQSDMNEIRANAYELRVVKLREVVSEHRQQIMVLEKKLLSREDNAAAQEQSSGSGAQEQSSGSEAQEQSSGNEAQEQSSGNEAQEQSSGSEAQELSSGSDPQEQSSGSDPQEQSSGSDAQEQTSPSATRKQSSPSHAQGQRSQSATRDQRSEQRSQRATRGQRSEQRSQSATRGQRSEQSSPNKPRRHSLWLVRLLIPERPARTRNTS